MQKENGGMIMKKGILLFLTTLLCLGLTACTEQKTTPPVSGQSSQQEEPDTQSSAEVADAASTSEDSHQEEPDTQSSVEIADAASTPEDSQQEEPDTQSSAEIEKSQSTDLQELQSDSEDTEAPESQERKLRMLVDGQELDVTLYDTPAANALYDMLPLTLTFEDFGYTEKIAYLETQLPTEGEPDEFDPDVGDLCLYAPWGNLSIFYQDFRNSNGLISLGHIDSGMDVIANMQGNFSVTLSKNEN